MMKRKQIGFFSLLVAVIFCSCQQDSDQKAEIISGVNYQIVVIDSCEYIIGRDNGEYNGGYFLSHKGNCKFCEQRTTKNK